MVQSTLRENGDEKAGREGRWGRYEVTRTLFPDQTVVAVVGVVGVTQPPMTVFEFEEFVAVFSGMSGAGGGEGKKRLTWPMSMDVLTSIFTLWAKEPGVSSFAHALGSGAQPGNLT